MKEIKLEIKFHHCQMEDLPEKEQELIRQAIKATDNSYAKYSKFRVGSAVLLADGTTIIGANQENAAFPSGLCAERTAIFAAQAQCPQHAIEVLAIAARNENGLTKEPITPCGSCRQVILEVEDRYSRPVRILLYGTSGIYVIESVKDLMPLSFVDKNMK